MLRNVRPPLTADPRAACARGCGSARLATPLFQNGAEVSARRNGGEYSAPFWYSIPGAGYCYYSGHRLVCRERPKRVVIGFFRL